MRKLLARGVVAAAVLIRWLSPLLAQEPASPNGAAAPARHAAPPANQAAAVQAVGAIGMTVSDLDRSVEFYTRVLGFAKEAEFEVAGEEWERLTGVFGVRLRIARLRLGGEALELSEYLAPE
ncbi:MAG TPA: VOC family protein, partial [Gemmatimonadales bacterium]|nr:VOC family protein [Gemmatimonadales bacterium]